MLHAAKHFPYATPLPNEDAIVWRTRAPALLDIVPKPWIEELAESARYAKRADREMCMRPDLVSHRPDWGTVNPGNPGVSFIYTHGEASYHVDTAFPRFFYLLILHSRCYQIDGGTWPEPFKPDLKGDLICLDSHRYHGLRASWSEGPEDLDPDACMANRTMPHFWAALSMESWAVLTPEQTFSAYERALLHTAARVMAQDLDPA